MEINDETDLSPMLNSTDFTLKVESTSHRRSSVFRKKKFPSKSYLPRTQRINKEIISPKPEKIAKIVNPNKMKNASIRSKSIIEKIILPYY